MQFLDKCAMQFILHLERFLIALEVPQDLYTEFEKIAKDYAQKEKEL